MVAMAASPTFADLLLPDGIANSVQAPGAAGIGVFGASINGVPVTSSGFLGGGMVSQVSIPANASDTIQVTFGFRWPFQLSSPVPVLGLQFQNRLLYDTSEVQILGASGAGGWTAQNFAGSFMTAKTSTATTLGAGGSPLKRFSDPGTGIVSTAPGFGRFAVSAPATTTVLVTTPTTIPFTDKGMLIPFGSTFPIMKVTLQAKSGVAGDNLVDLAVPPTSAFLIFRMLTLDPGGTLFSRGSSTLFYTGSRLGQVGGDFGVDVVPEPASAMLMGIGLFSLAGGAWRRRRRMGGTGAAV